MIAVLDTEFTDFIATHLISLGIACENGDEFYVEVDYPKHLASTFVKQVVEPFLTGYPVQCTYGQAAVRLANWLEERPNITLVADFSGDFILMKKLLDEVATPMPPCKNLLELFVNPCDELAYLRYEEGRDDYFRKVDMRQHHALVDSKAMLMGMRAAKLL